MLLLIGLLFLSAANSLAPFSYSGDTGPAFWANLDSANADCANPTNDQSPINIDPIAGVVNNPPDLEELEIEEIPKGTFKFINLGFTAQVQVKSNDETLTKGGLLNGFELIEFHYHAPSEHTINNFRFPLEMQMVHKHPETGEQVVLAILFEAQPAPNPFLDSHFKKIPEIQFESLFVDVEVEPYSVLRGFDLPIAYYQYRGSLTNPPCTQPVRWFIPTQIAGISPTQLQQIRSLLKTPNNRGIQVNDNLVKAFVPEQIVSYF
jgi:carbonic anhydrase